MAAAGELVPSVERWSGLAEAARNIFATPEWIDTWWQHCGRGERYDIVRDSYVLPLELTRIGFLRVARLAGHGAGDELGAAGAAAHRELAAAEIPQLPVDVFLGEQLPADAHWPGHVLRRGDSPVLRFDAESWDDLVATWSANLREQSRRAPRRLQRDYGVELRLTNADSLERDLDVLFRLHAARWPGATSFTRRESFHRAFARVALERDWMRLWVLELDERPAAAWYGFRYAGVESYYQAGRDASFDRYSVGFVILLHSIREAFEDGMSEYRFLYGGEAFKYRFATEDPGLVTVGLGLTGLGRTALAAARMADGVRLRVRRRRS